MKCCFRGVMIMTINPPSILFFILSCVITKPSILNRNPAIHTQILQTQISTTISKFFPLHQCSEVVESIIWVPTHTCWCKCYWACLLSRDGKTWEHLSFVSYETHLPSISVDVSCFVHIFVKYLYSLWAFFVFCRYFCFVVHQGWERQHLHMWLLSTADTVLLRFIIWNIFLFFALFSDNKENSSMMSFLSLFCVKAKYIDMLLYLLILSIFDRRCH